MNKMKSKRFSILLLCLIVVFLPVLSRLYIANHSEHHCTGKDCSVCMELKLANDSINSLESLTLVSVGTVFMLAGGLIFVLLVYTFSRRVKTLISLKVELMN